MFDSFESTNYSAVSLGFIRDNVLLVILDNCLLSTQTGLFKEFQVVIQTGGHHAFEERVLEEWRW